MSERREWWINVHKIPLTDTDTVGSGYSNHQMALRWATERDETVHVREVLPGDDSEPVNIKDAKIKALESTIARLRNGMKESCRDDRIEAMGGCVYAAELTRAARECREIMSRSSWNYCEYESKEDKAAEVYTKLTAALRSLDSK